MSEYHSKKTVKRKVLNYTQEVADEIKRAMKEEKETEMRVIQNRILLKGVFHPDLEKQIAEEAERRGVSRKRAVEELVYEGFAAKQAALRKQKGEQAK